MRKLLYYINLFFTKVMAKFEIWSKEYEKNNSVMEDMPNVEDIPAVEIPSEDIQEPEIIDPTPENQLPDNFGDENTENVEGEGTENVEGE